MLPQVRVGDFVEVLADEDGPTEGQYLWVIQIYEIYQDVQVPPLPNLLLFPLRWEKTESILALG